jgi:hypothetical protein
MTKMFKKSAQWELRVLVRTLLAGHIKLDDGSADGQLVPVFETIPAGIPLPYVALTNCKSTNESTKDAYEDDMILDLHVFTDYGGTHDNVSILSVVYELLTDAWNTGVLNFTTTSDFCITMFWTGDEETSLAAESGLAKRIKEELEESRLELMFRVKQLR